MARTVELILEPRLAADAEAQRRAAAREIGVASETIHSVLLRRRSIDARHGQPRVRLSVEVHFDPPPAQPSEQIAFRPARSGRSALVVGSGPAGLFAALRLLELGVRPIVLERGKDVRQRGRDLQALDREGLLDPHSNYCFGEGGAGTYSDGKLYTRSTKRGDVRRILALLCQHGATPEIQIDTHAHIGSERLPGIVRRMRETLRENEGEICFNAHVTDLILAGGRVRGVIVNGVEERLADAVVLATGHSARDVYRLLAARGLALEAKSFAMGVRIEHPQELIDRVQYRKAQRGPFLPAASYTLNAQVDGRGVYSFCMCPGGRILAASTAADELVVNGASPSRRDSPFANSGLVVSVQPEDWAPHAAQGVFAGLALQQQLERAALQAGGGKQLAPAQRATDFLRRKVSSSLGPSSYLPQPTPAALHEILPAPMVVRLAEALRLFNRKLPGYVSDEAQLFAVESRTSSPLRVPRDRETRMHVEVEGLFPCGEGAGYAGGIVSSAMDGERSADAVGRYLRL